ncbi:MAG: hypothetical protein ACRD0X_02670 [Thermoanaerobaculia bacterium]
MSHPYDPPAELAGLERRAWLAAAVGLAGAAGGFAVDRHHFFRAYLVAWLWVLGIALGCFAVALLHQLTRGAWGLMLRRSFGAATRTLPWLALLFVPVVLGLSDLYVWARPEAVAADPALQHKTWFLNRNGFILRAILYFAIWCAPMWLLNRLSLKQDARASDRTFRAMQKIAAPALGLYCLTATLAAIDWLMSLDPHWYSSMYGLSFIGGHAVSAMAFGIVVAVYLAGREPMRELLQPRHFHDYGKLLLAFVMLWAYFQVSQLIIVWSGNLPEEVPYYLARTADGWRWLSLLLAVGHFGLPFLLLLSQDLKRDARRLVWVALLLLAMRWIDLYWQAAPALAHGEPASPLPNWIDFSALLGVGGLWLALFLRQLARRPLLPSFEPYLKEALAHD